MITVQDRDVHHWLWRLRGLAEVMPGTVQAAAATSLASSLRRETVGLYVDAPVVQVPEDLAQAILGILDVTATFCAGSALGDEACADAALLAVAMLGHDTGDGAEPAA
jgi:hypothetical protein